MAEGEEKKRKRRKRKEKTQDEDKKEEEEEIGDHQAELEALKEKDPEFYAFLEENDENLLKFEDGIEDDEIEEESEFKEVVVEEKQTGGGFTLAKLRSMQKNGTVAGYIKLAKKACSEESNIADPGVRIEAMRIAAKELGSRLTEKNAKIGIKAYANALTTQTAGSILPLEAARGLRHLTKFVKGSVGAKIGRRLLRGLVDVFAKSNVLLEEHAGGEDDENDENDDSDEAKKLQVEAFLRIREIIQASFDKDEEEDLVEFALRKSYSAFTATAGKQSATNAAKNARRSANLAFLAAAVADLFVSSRPRLSYTLAFGYVRQLALAVRSALADAQHGAQVLSWKFLHATRLWASVATNSMPPLVFPLCQILFGALQLAGDQNKYAPFRLHCINTLNALCARRELYVPTVKPLMALLEQFLTTKLPSGQSKKRKKLTHTTTALEAAVMIDRVLVLTDDDLSNRIFQDEIVRETTYLLTDWLELCRYTAGLPELLVVPVVDLKRILKSTQKNTSKTAIACAKSCLGAFTSAAQNIANLRSKTFSQKSAADLLEAGFEPLKPSSLPSAADRLQRRRKERIARKTKLLDEHTAATATSSPPEPSKDEPDQPRKKQKRQLPKAADFFALDEDQTDNGRLDDVSEDDISNNADDVITALNIDDF